jgi:hypothetical protein
MRAGSVPFPRPSVAAQNRADVVVRVGIMKKLALLGLLLLGGVPEAKAYTTIGTGGVSCGTWTLNRRSYLSGQGSLPGYVDELEEATWIICFLWGVGYVGLNGDDPLHNVDGAGVWAWIDNYCRANPIKNLLDAAKAFVDAHPH